MLLRDDCSLKRKCYRGSDVHHQGLVLSSEVRGRLAQVSLSTVRRMIPPSVSKPHRIAYRRGPQAVARHISVDIPMKRISRQELQAEHFGVDLVHRCRVSASGQYVHTLQMTDVTNPCLLRQEIQDLIDQLFALTCAMAGETEDVYQTLL